MGPFFSRLAREIIEGGGAVRQVNFNGGDSFFQGGQHAITYRGAPLDWPRFLEAVLEDFRADTVVLFGDMRPIHRAAIPVAMARGVRIVVLEEGYFRPNYVTVELGGVNANSSLPTDAATYRDALVSLPELEEPRDVGATFGLMGWYATVYSIAMTLAFFAFPRYQHHRPLNAFVEAFSWVRGYLRKRHYLRKERTLHARIFGELSGRYYLVPLQVHNDAQIRHSEFSSVDAFAEFAIAAFAEYADSATHLVVKHHPMDRPYREYAARIRDHAHSHGVSERVHYVHDPDLAATLSGALGTITLNSTVGLQSLEAGVPTKVLGTALYDLEGLTYQGTLAQFLRAPGTVDLALFQGWKRHVVQHTQANGSFYRRLPAVDGVGASGLLWPKTRAARARSSGVSTPRKGA